MRRFLTFIATAALTATAALHWLHDGDMVAAVQPVMAEWDAELLARNAGLVPAAPNPGGGPDTDGLQERPSEP
jgi:hypothetical protein